MLGNRFYDFDMDGSEIALFYPNLASWVTDQSRQVTLVAQRRYFIHNHRHTVSFRSIRPSRVTGLGHGRNRLLVLCHRLTGRLWKTIAEIRFFFEPCGRPKSQQWPNFFAGHWTYVDWPVPKFRPPGHRSHPRPNWTKWHSIQDTVYEGLQAYWRLRPLSSRQVIFLKAASSRWFFPPLFYRHFAWWFCACTGLRRFQILFSTGTFLTRRRGHPSGAGPGPDLLQPDNLLCFRTWTVLSRQLEEVLKIAGFMHQ